MGKRGGWNNKEASRIERQAPIGLEDDCDQAMTPMVKWCTRWECQREFIDHGKDITLRENRMGFMVCPLCDGSYGLAPTANASSSNV